MSPFFSNTTTKSLFFAVLLFQLFAPLFTETQTSRSIFNRHCLHFIVFDVTQLIFDVNHMYVQVMRPLRRKLCFTFYCLLSLLVSNATQSKIDKSHTVINLCGWPQSGTSLAHEVRGYTLCKQLFVCYYFLSCDSFD